MGGEELKWHQLAHYQLMSQQRPHFSPHSKAKANYKAQISEKLVTSGISDVVIASVHSEKTRLKKMIMIIIVRSFFVSSREAARMLRRQAWLLVEDEAKSGWAMHS